MCVTCFSKAYTTMFFFVCFCTAIKIAFLTEKVYHVRHRYVYSGEQIDHIRGTLSQQGIHVLSPVVAWYACMLLFTCVHLSYFYNLYNMYNLQQSTKFHKTCPLHMYRCDMGVMFTIILYPHPGIYTFRGCEGYHPIIQYIHI